MPHLMSARGELQSEQFQPKGITTLWDLTLAQAEETLPPLPFPPVPGGPGAPSTEALRECLNQCQNVEGKSFEECQARCAGLSAGTTGPTNFFENFFRDFKIPGGVSSLAVIVIAAILVIISLALLTR